MTYLKRFFRLFVVIVILGFLDFYFFGSALNQEFAIRQVLIAMIAYFIVGFYEGIENG